MKIFKPTLFALVMLMAGTVSAQPAPADTTQRPLMLPDSLRQGTPAIIDTLGAADSTMMQTQQSDLDTAIYYEALVIDNDLQKRQTYFIGDAVVKYKEMTLQAGKITLDWDAAEITAEAIAETTWVKTDTTATDSTMDIKIIGQPNLIEGGQTMVGEKMVYNYKSEKGRVVRGRSEIEGGQYMGTQIKRVDDKTYNISNSIYTTCELDTAPHFHFEARRMKMIQNDKVIAKPVVLYIHNIPMAAIPFAVFPNKRGRQSGILIPNFGQSALEGRYLRGIGYYWAPNDYFDTKFSVDFFEKSGFMFHNTTRYQKRYSLRGTISGSLTRKNFETGTQQRRWDLRISHNQRIDPTSNLNVSGNFVSDNTYYQNFSNNLDTRLTRELRSRATYTKNWREANISLSANVSQSHDLQEDLRTTTLPQMSLSKRQTQIFKPKRSGRQFEKWYHSLYVSYNTHLTNQAREQWLTEIEQDTAGLDTTRFKETIRTRQMTHNVGISLNSPQKFFGILSINQGLNITDNWYDESYQFRYDEESDQIVRKEVGGLAMQHQIRYNARANTKLYGMFPGVGPFVAFRHVMTPSVSFGFEPNYKDLGWGVVDVMTPDGLVARDIFTGSTPSEGSANINWSVSNLFQTKILKNEKEQKLDLFNLDFSSGYDFRREENKMQDLRSRFSVSSSSLRNINISASASHSFYQFDTEANRLTDTYLWESGGWKDLNFLRLTNLSLNMSFRLQGEDDGRGAGMGRGNQRLAQSYEEMQRMQQGAPEDLLESQVDRDRNRFEPESDIDRLTIPWRMNVSLRYSLSKRNPANPSKRFYVRVSNAEIRLTNKWKMGYNVYYDLIDKQIVNHQVSIYRDLHCWEAFVDWIPSGPAKHIYVRVSIKAPMLQDIKLEKRQGRSSVLGY